MLFIKKNLFNKYNKNLCKSYLNSLLLIKEVLKNKLKSIKCFKNFINKFYKILKNKL